jgi:hypothetical protein
MRPPVNAVDQLELLRKLGSVFTLPRFFAGQLDPWLPKARSSRLGCGVPADHQARFEAL